MSVIWRILKWALLGAAGLGVVGVVALTWLFMRSAPDYNGAYRVEGPRAEIEIIRDQRAVPHIFAKTEYDAFFGLGFVHAQDRLWQMELSRRIAQGRLTELANGWDLRLGMREEALRLDATLRALDLHGRSERALDVQTPATLRALQAYADGVNAWLAIVDEEALGGGAPELMALGARVDPWTPADSLAAFKVLAATLSASAFSELRRARFLRRFGEARTQDLFPDAPGGAVVALPPYASDLDGPVRFSAAPSASDWDDAWPFDAAEADFAGASNAWVVSGARSVTRRPLLASDPHLGLSAPGIWYMARIQLPEGGAIGGTIAGIPAVLVGRNAQLAWGLTTLYADTADFYLERVNDDDPTQYRTADGWASFVTREEQIPIGGGEAVAVTVRETERGPVLPLGWEAVAAVTPENHVLSVSWTVLDVDDRSVEAAIGLMRAPSVQAAIPLAELVAAPTQNVFLADRRDIAMVSIGRAPLRAFANRAQGRVPTAGWRRINQWRGVVPVSRMPRALNPEGGAIANANNRTTDARYPFHLGFDWPAPYRIQRLEKLLGERQFHTMRGFQAMQLDTVSEMARAVLRLLAADLWATRGDGAPDPDDPRAVALAMLADWNGDMDAFRPEPLIFTAWARAATRLLTQDELDDMTDSYQGVRPLFLERVYRNIDGAGDRWCDDRRTEPIETCAEISSRALDAALAELSAQYGPDPESWSWGAAHAAVHRHQPMHWTPASWLFDIVTETGGGDHTLFRGRIAGSGEHPYRNVHAGGYRAIYDLSDLDRSVYAVATGQSGHFLSRHYDDPSLGWAAGAYAPLSLERGDAEAGSVGVIRLIPAD